MPRPEKVAVVEEVRDELTDSAATLFADYRGLAVDDMAELRRRLTEANARFLVAKNTLTRIAAREAGFDDLGEVLTGPTALTFCDDDPVGPAKALRSFSQEHPELVVKGAILEGRLVDAETAQKLADLESREELLARLARLMYAALANTASLLQAPVSQLARVMAALEEQGGAPGAPAEPETAEVPEAAAEPETAEAPEEPEEAAAAEEPEEADEVGEAEEASGPAAAARDTAADAVATAGQTVGGAVAAAGDAVEDVLDAAAEVPEDAGEAAEDAIEAVGEAVESAAQTVGASISEGAEAVADAVAPAEEEAAEEEPAEEPAADEAEDEEDAQQ